MSNATRTLRGNASRPHPLGSSRWLGFCVAAGLTAASGCSEPSEPETLDGPSFLLISIDSLRPDHLGCYGYARETSPVIDRLAREGVRFDLAVSTTSWTLPSHAALFTGMYDSAHGLVDNGLSLGDDHRTLAEALQASGYRTAGFYGGPYLHPTFGLGQGFEHYQSCMTTLADDLTDEQVRDQSQAPIGASHKDVTGPRTVAEFGRWLDGLDTSSPFFAFVHLWDVHYDYIPPPEIAALFVDPNYRGPVTGREFARTIRDRTRLSPADRAHLIGLYDAEIRFTDTIVGQLVDRLEGAGLLEDTVVIVTADHGEEFFEHQGWGHQSSLFDEQILIPLIVRWPAVFEPRAVPDQVRLIDVMPTVLSIAGMRRQPATQGRSLLPLMMGEALEPTSALAELHVDKRRLQALREADWKFFDADRWELQGGVHLAQDPLERKFLQGTAELNQGISRLRNEVKRAWDFGTELGRTTKAIDLNEDMLEALEGLGYTDG